MAFTFKSIIKQKKRKCKIFTENIRLEVAAKKAYYYPDLMFTCNPLDLQEKLTLRNPSLVVEVLSDGSFMTDLNHKLDNYIKMPSLLYYLVVSQDEYRVRVWEKTAEGWLYKVYSELSDVVNLTQIDMDLRMEEVYEEIEMEVNED
jgi:Uma2 family endonuclease